MQEGWEGFFFFFAKRGRWPQGPKTQGMESFLTIHYCILLWSMIFGICFFSFFLYAMSDVDLCNWCFQFLELGLPKLEEFSCVEVDSFFRHKVNIVWKVFESFGEYRKPFCFYPFFLVSQRWYALFSGILFFLGPLCISFSFNYFWFFSIQAFPPWLLYFYFHFFNQTLHTYPLPPYPKVPLCDSTPSSLPCWD